MFSVRHHQNIGYVETDPTGRYGRFDEELGKGAMKTVYKAFDEMTGREVAWNQAKLCRAMQSPETLQRMYAEVHLLSTLSHHSIIRFHSSWIDSTARTFNFITELFTSGSLREYRRRYRQVDMRAVKKWALQILNGLIYLHSHEPPVIHRDLKCDNIFVNGHLGQVKIGDLGLAAVLHECQSAHSVIGTPEFMAPELYEEEYNELVDVYSFGMCVLEMLTAEYPYSECTNPAQIYRKVTSGKLPDAFWKLKDTEARRFIGRCLQKASKRPSAEELLSDPFLQFDGRRSMPVMTTTMVEGSAAESCRSGREIVAGDEQHTDMTITGNIKPDDDAIYLKVQIADKDGHVNNIYFPFDIIRDTPIDVANEMVKELEITDREPMEIAEMISREIMGLLPERREGFDVYNFGDDDDDNDNDIGYNNPFHGLYSPSSTNSSYFGAFPSHAIDLRLGNPFNVAEWLREDDASSVNSVNYSAINYYSGNELDCELSYEQPNLISSPKAISKSTRKCALVKPMLDTMQCSMNRSGKWPVEDGRSLLRNRSMLDIRSQQLQNTLVKELTKRLFKTVGAVENIGFQMPSEVPHRNYSSKPKGDDMKLNKK